VLLATLISVGGTRITRYLEEFVWDYLE